MKGWMVLLVLVLLPGLAGAAGCAPSVPLEDYNKAKSELAASQVKSQKLESDLTVAQAQVKALQSEASSAKADADKAKSDMDRAKADLTQAQGQVKTLQSEVSSGKADADKAKADLTQAQAQVKTLQSEVSSGKADLDRTKGDLDKASADLTQARAQLDKAQKSLSTAQPYAKFLDLLLEQQRQEIGIKPKYWQYSSDYVRSETVKAAEASKDATLKALIERSQQEREGGQAGWWLWVYSIAATTGILNGDGVPAASLPRPAVVTSSPTGETVLRVRLLQTDDKPIPNVEVDLWSEDAPSGPPNAGVTQTDASGVATFTVAPGNYRVDFNSSRFPSAFIIPRGRSVQVQAAKITEVEVRAFSK